MENQNNLVGHSENIFYKQIIEARRWKRILYESIYARAFRTTTTRKKYLKNDKQKNDANM